jgi:GDP-L-fucose synthase
MREFLHVGDMAAASIYAMELASTIHAANTQAMLSHANVGTGVDCTIRELVETVAKITGYQGDIEFGTSKPDGALRKLMNVERLAKLGWRSRYSLEEGLSDAYRWFLNNQDYFRQI